MTDVINKDIKVSSICNLNLSMQKKHCFEI